MPPSDDAQRRVSDWIRRARGGVVFTRFLDPAAAETARRECARAGMGIALYGGYDDAERRMAAIYPDGEDAPRSEAFPLRCLAATWDGRYGSVGHRDLLGALLGLGLSRDVIGDIRVSDGRALIYASREMAGAIAGLTQAGRTSVRVSEIDEAPSIEVDQGEVVSATVATLRLDAVLSAGLRLSRERVRDLIAAGLVKRNHEPDMKPDRAVSEGDVFSVRGYGRLEIAEVGGESRKGRRFVRILRR